MANSGRPAIWRLAAARAMSDTGSWAASLALAIAIFAETGSTVWLSMSFLLTQAPAALLSPAAGVIADRWNRRALMIGCDLFGAVCYVAMALFHAPAALISVGAIAALLHLPFGPSAAAAVPNLVGEDELSWANGILAGAGGTGTLLGPALAGTLAAIFGKAAPVFVFNAATFVVSASLITTIRGPFSRLRPEEAADRTARDVWAGWRYIGQRPVLMTLMAVGAVTFIASEIGWVADLPLVHLFGAGSFGYGMMMTAWGAGMLIGGFAAARLVKKAREPRAAVLGVLLFGAFLACVGLVPWFVGVPIALFFVGASDSFAGVGFAGIYQRGTPDELRGRVFAAVGGSIAVSTALGFTFAGFLVRALGPRPIYVIGGVIDMVAAAVLGTALARSPTLHRFPGQLKAETEAES